MSDAVAYSVSGGVALLELRPTGARLPNLSAATVAGLGAALDRIESDPTVRCAVLTGTGDGFAVGADIKALGAMSAAESHAYNATIVTLAERLETGRVPVIAAINGHAYGGGLEIALACAFRIAASEARMGLPEVQFGLVPACGGTPRLLRLVGPGAAAELTLVGRLIGADEALAIRLVEAVVPRADVVAEALARASAIAAADPAAVAAMRRALRAVGELSVPAGAEYVHELVGELLASATTQERIAAYLEKRPVRE